MTTRHTLTNERDQGVLIGAEMLRSQDVSLYETSLAVRHGANSRYNIFKRAVQFARPGRCALKHSERFSTMFQHRARPDGRRAKRPLAGVLGQNSLSFCVVLIMIMFTLTGCGGEFYFRVIDGSRESLTEAVSGEWVAPDSKTKGKAESDKPGPTPGVSPGSDNSRDINKDYVTQPKTSFSAYKERVAAQGFYLTANSAGVEETFLSRVGFVQGKGMNAIVIDVKDEFGNVTFKNKIAVADELGISVNYIRNVEGVLARLKENGIYAIARIVVFKDKAIADKRPEYVIPLNDGTKYWERDSKGEPQFCWLNPYNRDVWDYVVDVAVDAAKLGFDEIQFDYIRFPTDSNIKNAVFGEAGELQSYTEVIAEFSRYAVERLKPYGVTVSADVFGTIIISGLDASLIGQDLIELAGIFDVLCPMIYPSHFADNTLGVALPDLAPYDIIYKTLALMNEKLSASGLSKPAAIRPWLQDFTATWLKKYKTYGAAEIKAQIQACIDNGITEWLLWDPSNRYNGASGL